MPRPDSIHWMKAQTRWNPEPATFADLVVDAYLQRCGAAASPAFDAGAFSLRAADGSLVFLEPHHGAFCAAGGDVRDAVLEQAVGALQPHLLPESRAQARTRLMPRLWSRDAEDRHGRDLERLGLSTFPIARRPWHDVLLRGLAIDGEHTLTPVTEAVLSAWDLTFEEAWRMARENLAARTPSGVSVEESPGLFRVAVEDGHDAARVFLPETLSFPPEEIVAVAPARDLLLWCRRDDPVALRELLELAAQSLEPDRRGLAPVLLTSPSSGWVTLDLPPGHPAQEQARMLTLRWLAEAYALQRERLVEAIERAGRDEPWVATYALFVNRSTGRAVSCATLTRGVPTLLPRTEWLSFADADSGPPPTITSWDAGVAALGGEGMLRSIEAFPPRYLVSTFPDGTALARLPEV